MVISYVTLVNGGQWRLNVSVTGDLHGT